MPSIRFTAAKVKAIQPPTEKAQEEYRDDRYPGLLLKIGKGGTKSWAYRSTRQTEGGRRPWTKLGRYPAVSYKDALAKYRAEEERLENDRPPVEIKDRIAELEAELRALRRMANLLTFEGLYKEYDRRYLVKMKNPDTDRRTFKKDPLRVWEGRPVCDIDKRDVVALIDEVVGRGAPHQAGRVLTKVRALFNWGIKNDLVESNPAFGIEAPVKSKARERNLTEEEIRQMWHELEVLPPAAADAIRLCLVTGQRRAEVGGMKWREIERAEDGRVWWNIPAKRTKTHRSSSQPL